VSRWFFFERSSICAVARQIAAPALFLQAVTRACIRETFSDDVFCRYRRFHRNAGIVKVGEGATLGRFLSSSARLESFFGLFALCLQKLASRTA